MLDEETAAKVAELRAMLVSDPVRESIVVESTKCDNTARERELAAKERAVDAKLAELDWLIENAATTATAEDAANPDCITVSALPRIYALFRDEVCVYIGQTTRPWPSRIGDHARSHTKAFNLALGWPCPKKRLNAVEELAIKKLSPEYNTKGRDSRAKEYSRADSAAIITALIQKKRLR